MSSNFFQRCFTDRNIIAFCHLLGQENSFDRFPPKLTQAAVFHSQLPDFYHLSSITKCLDWLFGSSFSCRIQTKYNTDHRRKDN